MNVGRGDDIINHEDVNCADSAANKLLATSENDIVSASRCELSLFKF